MNNNNISSVSQNTISLDELTNEKELNIEDDEKVKSAIQLILQKASKRFPDGKLPTSITINTGTTPVTASDNKTINDEISNLPEEKNVKSPKQIELVI